MRVHRSGEEKMEDEYFTGQIIATAFGFVPRGFRACDGQLLPVNLYRALFSLLGTRYGGDGIMTFALPDLRGRTVVGAGTSADDAWKPSPYALGAFNGADTVALKSTQLVTHTHDINATATGVGDLRGAAGNVLGVSNANQIYRSGSATKVTLAANAVASRGAGAGHENMQPFQVLNYVMAVNGMFPPRP
jgi:microcystin-dependent protein